jgi:hypothetical protein
MRLFGAVLVKRYHMGVYFLRVQHGGRVGRLHGKMTGLVGQVFLGNRYTYTSATVRRLYGEMVEGRRGI